MTMTSEWFAGHVRACAQAVAEATGAQCRAEILPVDRTAWIEPEGWPGLAVRAPDVGAGEGNDLFADVDPKPGELRSTPREVWLWSPEDGLSGWAWREWLGIEPEPVTFVAHPEAERVTAETEDHDDEPVDRPEWADAAVDLIATTQARVSQLTAEVDAVREILDAEDPGSTGRALADRVRTLAGSGARWREDARAAWAAWRSAEAELDAVREILDTAGINWANSASVEDRMRDLAAHRRRLNETLVEIDQVTAEGGFRSGTLVGRVRRAVDKAQETRPGGES